MSDSEASNGETGRMSALYVIDGFSMAYRGHFALMRNPVMTSTGINTSSILVFGNVLMGLLEREKPEYLVVVFDTPEPTFRHKAYADYKAGRDAMPDDLAVAIPRILDLGDALQSATLQAPGWEADDLAATLAHQARLRESIATSSPRTVSYTHQTLPTICSV